MPKAYVQVLTGFAIVAAIVALSFAMAQRHPSQSGLRPIESASPTVVDYRPDVVDFSAKHADSKKYPEGDAALMHIVIKNHGAAPAFYQIIFAVYDGKLNDTSARIMVDTETSNYGPLKPGQTLKINGPYLTDGVALPDKFSVDVQSVDRRESL